MTIKPEKTAPQPKYPDKYSITVKKIETARPRRWVGLPLVTGVLTAAITLGLCGCDSNTLVIDRVPLATPNIGLEIDVFPMPADTDNLTFVTSEPNRIGSIPIFLFGEGTGTIGCMAVNSPVFLSEEEAVALLSTVFEEAGLKLSSESNTLEGAKLPITDKYGTIVENEINDTVTVQGDLEIDGLLDVAGGLPIAFVSANDIDTWQKDTDYVSSVESYDFRDTAKILANNNSGLAVFYDPAVLCNFDWSKVNRLNDETDEEFAIRCDAALAAAKQEARAESEQLLRQQIEAFLQWLHAKEII